MQQFDILASEKIHIFLSQFKAGYVGLLGTKASVQPSEGEREAARFLTLFFPKMLFSQGQAAMEKSDFLHPPN